MIDVVRKIILFCYSKIYNGQDTNVESLSLEFAEDITTVFENSYPALWNVPISVSEFCYLSMLAVSLFRPANLMEKHIEIIKFLITSLLGDEINPHIIDADHFEDTLNKWPSLMVTSAFSNNSFYSFDALFALFQHGNNFLNLDATKLFSPAAFIYPDQMIRRFLLILDIESNSDHVNEVIVKSLFCHSQSGLLSYPNVPCILATRVEFIRKIRRSTAIKDAMAKCMLSLAEERNSEKVNEILTVLYYYYGNQNSEIRLLHQMLIEKRSSIPEQYEFQEQNSSAVFLNVPRIFIRLCSSVLHEAPLKALIVHPQVGSLNCALMAFQEDARASVFALIYTRIDSLVHPDPEKWKDLSNFYFNLTDENILAAILMRRKARPTDLIFFPKAPESLYENWFAPEGVRRSPWQWQDSTMNLNWGIVDIHSGFHSNLMKSNQEPLQAYHQVFPLSFALILENEVAVDRIIRYSKLTIEHREEALRIADEIGSTLLQKYKLTAACTIS